jgi:hypothetical protein
LGTSLVVDAGVITAGQRVLVGATAVPYTALKNSLDFTGLNERTRA